MSKATRSGSDSPAPDGSPGPPSEGMSPYATGGGGVTFERKVAVHYLAHLLVGSGAPEFGDGRRLESVGFQQAPSESVDDLVLSAALPDEPAPSLVLALAARSSLTRLPQLARDFGEFGHNRDHNYLFSLQPHSISLCSADLAY